jgi:outer membrane protein assembly factor BamB
MALSLVVVAILSLAAAEASDWPQWRGASRDAVSLGLESPRPWPSELTREWRFVVGAGQSSPVVSADTVFLFTREGDEEVARALDLATGRLRWRQGYQAPHEVYPGAASFGSGPKSTPVVHEGRLFTLGIGGILSAFDAATGRLLWQEGFAGRFRETAPPFGTSMSPLVAAGMLIVHAGGHPGGALIAFDPATGREVWAREGDGPSYSSPILTSFLGQAQIVIQVHRKVLGVEPTSGQVLWSLPFVTPCDQNIVTPLRAGELLILSSLDQGTMGVRVAREGAGWTPQVVWHTAEVSMYMSTPILVQGRVLGLSHRKRGQYFLLDPETGKVLWTSEGGRGENSALVVVGDSVLALEGEGRLLVLPAAAAAFSPLATYRVGEAATIAHPIPTARGILVKDEAGLSLYRAQAGPRAGGGMPAPAPAKNEPRHASF